MSRSTLLSGSERTTKQPSGDKSVTGVEWSHRLFCPVSSQTASIERTSNEGITSSLVHSTNRSSARSTTRVGGRSHTAMEWRLLIQDKDRADVSLLSPTRLEREAIHVGHNSLGFGECHDICGSQLSLASSNTKSELFLSRWRPKTIEKPVIFTFNLTKPQSFFGSSRPACVAKSSACNQANRSVARSSGISSIARGQCAQHRQDRFPG